MKYPALHNLTQFSGSWKYVKTEQSQQTVSLAKIMKRAHVKSFRRIMAGIKEHKQKIKVNCLTNELEVSDEIGFYSLHLDGLYHPLQHPLLGFCKAKVTFESSPNVSVICNFLRSNNLILMYMMTESYPLHHPG